MTYEDELKKILPSSCDYFFHGTTIWNAIEILKTNQITAEIDRDKNANEPLNMSGFINVTTLDNVWFTIKQFADLSNYNYPAGCIFVLSPTSEKEFLLAKKSNKINNIHNLYPNRLIAIISTAESCKILKDAVHNLKIDIDHQKFKTYEDFLEENKINENI